MVGKTITTRKGPDFDKEKKANTTPTTAHNYIIQLREQINTLLPRTGLLLIDANRRWTDRYMVIGMILWCWSANSSVKDRFADARTFLIKAYPARKRPGASHESLMHCLKRHHCRLQRIVMTGLREKIIQRAGDLWETDGFVVLGADGTKIDMPRTDANLHAFGTNKKHAAPQKVLTCLFHLATHAAWSFRHEGAKGSERRMLKQMLEDLPEKSMILADAGFTGWDTLNAIQQAGHAFIIRAGANVRLLTNLQVRQRGDVVFLWPKGQQKRCVRPLVLRRLTVQLGRGTTMCLLTNMLDHAVLSDKTMCKFYQMRWGVEVSYRWLKRSMQGHKMLSQSPDRVSMELDWTMVGLCLLTLISLGEKSRDADRLSLSGTLRVIRDVMAMKHVGRCRKCLSLLLTARTDTYSRNSEKCVRLWPRKGRKHTCMTPQVRKASAAEVLLYEELRAKAA